MFNRSRRNLARWFTLSMGSILTIFAGAIFYQQVTNKLEELDRLLYKKSNIMAASVQYEFHQGQWQVNLDNVPLLGIKSQSLSSELVYARWYDAEGQLVQFYGLPSSEKLIASSEFLTIETTSANVGESPTVEWLRQVTLPVEYDGVTIGYLQVATSMTPIRETLREFLLLLALAVPGTLGVIGFVGRALGGLAMQPIRQAYEQLQRFTADASHELRSPLSAILSNAQVGLLACANDGSQQKQRHRFEKIVNLVKSTSVLVGDLLFLARHAGRLTPESLKEIELGSWLQELVDTYATQATAKQLNLPCEIPQQPVKVRVEPTLLAQAVGNLLENACHYTPRGGTIWLRLLIWFGRVVIQIEDSGIGIPKEDLPHVFERFYRAKTVRSHEDRTKGFGLGLAIAQQIVEAHGGHISVNSIVGRGTTFTIEFPTF
jgi:signal transduction histidine kinase